MPLPPGTTLGHYEILSSIGAGGMGEVYKVRDTHLDRTVAIKVLPEHVALQSVVKAIASAHRSVRYNLALPGIAGGHGARRGTWWWRGGM